MMWRLNFLVTITCLVLRNSYMLYYICPMHTLFTLMVYGALAIAKDHNNKDWVIWIKYVGDDDDNHDDYDDDFFLLERDDNTTWRN